MSTQTARRFANNTVTKPIDRRRVLGFGPGLRMNMNPRASNLPGYAVPQGQLIIFNPRVDGFLQNKMKSVTGPNGERLLSYDGFQEHSGRFFAEAVDAKFHGGEDDFGFRILECLTDLDYDINTGEDQADAYFNTLYPDLDCEMGLEEVAYGPAGDLLNKGLPLPCPTCRLKWLEGTAAQEAIFSSPLDPARLELLRLALVTAFSAGRIHAQVRFDKSKGEVESPQGKQAYDDADYHFMKMLHKKPAHIEQAEITSAAAKIQGEAIGASVAKAFADAREFDEFQKWKAAQSAPTTQGAETVQVALGETEESFGEKMAKARAAKKAEREA